MEQVSEDGPPVELLHGNMGERREADIGAGEVSDVGERDSGANFGDGGYTHEL